MALWDETDSDYPDALRQIRTHGTDSQLGVAVSAAPRRYSEAPVKALEILPFTFGSPGSVWGAKPCFSHKGLFILHT